LTTAQVRQPFRIVAAAMSLYELMREKPRGQLHSFCRITLSGNLFQQFCRSDFERAGEFADRVQRWALPGAFEYADVVAMKVGHFREFLLRYTLRQTKLAQPFPKELSLLLDTHEGTGLRLGLGAFYLQLCGTL
jgi:hypothetical protein